MKALRIGVLSFQGDVSEHMLACESAAQVLKKKIEVLSVRTKEDLRELDALIIPGGESTTLSMLCEREGMFPGMKKIPNIFGTCAGAIFISRDANGKAKEQETLGLMDISVNRNAYGTQNDSFEEDIQTSLGRVHAVFIRAPRITGVGKDVSVLAKNGKEIVACEEKKQGKYYLATSFHPELTTTLFHEHFLKQII
jgi:5'-phosphate synthase pdxT subunit